MKEPVDDFARKLRELRQAQQLSAQDLSLRCRKRESYVGRWERERCPINKTILQRAVEVLQPSESDRRELFRLADLREAPPGAADLYEASNDPDTHLFRALLEVPNTWPNKPPDPNPRSESVKLLLDAMGWFLAVQASRAPHILPPFLWEHLVPADWKPCDEPTARFKSIRWPKPLVELGIVQLTGEPDEQLEIPEAVLREELPTVGDLRDPITPLEAHMQSRGMARVYRRLLFGDMERARAAARLIARWEYEATPEQFGRVSIQLGWDPTNRMGLRILGDVDCRTTAFACERRLAFDLWHFSVNRKKRDLAAHPWYCPVDQADLAALQAVGQLDVEKLVADHRNRQRLIDAMVIVEWGGCPAVLRAMRDEYKIELHSEPDMERQLNSGRLDASTRAKIVAEPWRLASIYAWHGILNYLGQLEWNSRGGLDYRFLLVPDPQGTRGQDTASVSTDLPAALEEGSRQVDKGADAGKPPRKPRKKGKTRKGKT